MPRCGKCQNCIDLERIKARVLACCNPIQDGNYPSRVHADDGVVNLWNTELARLPCASPPKETP